MNTAKKSRFYIAKINERNGEYEYSHITRMKLDTDEKPEEALKNIASTWYGGEADAQDDDCFYFHDGCVCVTPGEIHEVSEQIFDALHEIIP